MAGVLNLYLQTEGKTIEIQLEKDKKRLPISVALNQLIPTII